MHKFSTFEMAQRRRERRFVPIVVQVWRWQNSDRTRMGVKKVEFFSYTPSNQNTVSIKTMPTWEGNFRII